MRLPTFVVTKCQFIHSNKIARSLFLLFPAFFEIQWSNGETICLRQIGWYGVDVTGPDWSWWQEGGGIDNGRTDMLVAQWYQKEGRETPGESFGMHCSEEFGEDSWWRWTAQYGNKQLNNSCSTDGYGADASSTVTSLELVCHLSHLSQFECIFGNFLRNRA